MIGETGNHSPLLSALRPRFTGLWSVCSEDYPSLRTLALKYPLLNLPAEETLLKKKIELSKASFAQTVPMEKRSFLFVFKTLSGEVIGSSQITSRSGTVDTPSYSLQIREEDQKKILQLKTITDGPSYLGGLILAKEYRGCSEKAGKQLSLIRFLFAAMHPTFFKDVFHAEVAPFMDAAGANPFFEDFIKPRIPLSMEEIDYLTLTNKEKLFTSYPRDKILFSDLSPSVQKSLGKPGLFSRRAAELLKKQNFQFVNEVDPFDGGPYMQAGAKDIPLIQNTKKVFLKEEETKETGSEQSKKTKWLWGRMDQAQFRGGLVEGVLKKSCLYVSKEDLDHFFLSTGLDIFIAPF